jgi:hypothetical protein
MTHARQLVARQLLVDAAFEPDVIRAINQAFDEAWGEIASRFGTRLVVIEAARLKLADILLSIASEETRDVEVLKCFALQAMARDDRAILPIRATSVHSSNQAARRAAAREWWRELCVAP